MQPFSNIRVVDLTHVIAGPFCTYQLGVMGADVIKIEPPQMPDMVRAKSAEFPHGEKGLSTAFQAQNANKRSVCIDLKTESGKNILLALIATADVMVENYRAGAMKKLGLSYDDAKKVKPDIIYCSMTGFGQDGPLGNRTAYDNVIQAYSGLMSANGDAQTSPTKIGPPILDYGTGIQAAYAIAAALFQRETTSKGQEKGQGQYIDIAMLDSAMMLMSTNTTYYDKNNSLMPLTGNMSAFNAGYGCYQTKDGLIMLGAYTGKQVSNMWTVLGYPERGEKVRDMQPAGMAKYIEADTKIIEKELLEKTAARWETEFNQNRVPAARVRSLDEAMDDEQMQWRTVFQNLVDDENSRIPVAAFKYSDNGPSLRSNPPVFGQHTHEVLGELGYNENTIDQLEAQGVIAKHS